jgi:hypothetical protein
MKKILVSPGYGAGWSSWNSGEVAKFMAEYEPIIEAIENGEEINEKHELVSKMVEEIEEKFGENYVCIIGAEQLEVRIVSGPYRITDYDGYESGMIFQTILMSLGF